MTKEQLAEEYALEVAHRFSGDFEICHSHISETALNAVLFGYAAAEKLHAKTVEQLAESQREVSRLREAIVRAKFLSHKSHMTIDQQSGVFNVLNDALSPPAKRAHDLGEV